MHTSEISHSFFWQLLDENYQLIQTIADYQSKGRASEGMQ